MIFEGGVVIVVGTLAWYFAEASLLAQLDGIIRFGSPNEIKKACGDQ